MAPFVLLVSIGMFVGIKSLQKSAFYALSTDEIEDIWQYLDRLPAETELKCYIVCLRMDGCFATIYNTTRHECLFLALQTQFSGPFLISPSVKCMRKTEGVTVNLTVFRTSSGRGAEFYNPWINDSYVSPSTEGVDNLSQKINYTYKHPCLKHWNQLDILQVKLTLWKDQKEVVRLVFSAQGSTNMDWFSHDRILESSFVDLQNGPVDFMSIDGWEKTRRFYINKEHNGCQLEQGWMCLKETYLVCAWADQPPYPAFLYSKSNTAITWENNANLGLADELIISLSLRL